MSEAQKKLRQRWAMRTAAPMFWLSVLFLANTGTLIVLWVDVPRVSEAYLKSDVTAHPDDPDDNRPLKAMADERQLKAMAIERHLKAKAIDDRAHQIKNCCEVVELVLWPIFILEFLFYFFVRSEGRRFTRMGLFACFCPPLRMGVANLEMRERVWLPRFGWTRPTPEIHRELERLFGPPMIVIALMILPILLVEFGLKEQVADRNWLRIALHVSTGTIWFAFALEFIVMFSLAQKKLRYCKAHWLDLAIVLLPLLSFLRSMRVLRATRLARLAKIQYLTKLGRVYRLRGLAIKAFRAMAVVDLMNRVLPMTLERQLELLKEDLAENQRDGRDLQRRIAALESLIASQQADAATDEEDAADEEKAPADTAGKSDPVVEVEPAQGSDQLSGPTPQPNSGS